MEVYEHTSLFILKAMIKLELSPSEVASLVNLLEQKIERYCKFNRGTYYEYATYREIHNKLKHEEIRYYKSLSKLRETISS